jgi:hypothetical protein
MLADLAFLQWKYLWQQTNKKKSLLLKIWKFKIQDQVRWVAICLASGDSSG